MRLAKLWGVGSARSFIHSTNVYYDHVPGSVLGLVKYTSSEDPHLLGP